jgi:hypothetical protein
MGNEKGSGAIPSQKLFENRDERRQNEAREGCTLQGRKTGVYTEVHEDFEPSSNKVTPSAVGFQTASQSSRLY